MTLAANNLALSYSSAKNGKGIQSYVLAGASLQIKRGQVLVVQGPNGSGKSTLMKAFARQLRPQQGSVTLDDQDIWQMDVRNFAKKIAYVPQTLTAPASMTVYELVSLGRSPHQKIFQMSLSETDQVVVQKSLARCAVEGLQDKLVSQLSAGERQRTVIAMALCQGPDFLLLDEPTANLDFRYQLELIELLHQLKEEGLGIALILHDLNIAAQLADNVALIAGKTGECSSIFAQGKVQEVFAGDTLQKVFAVDIDIISGQGKTIYVPRRMESQLSQVNEII